MNRPEVRAYVERINSRVVEAWKAPRGTPDGSSVMLRMKLGADGSVQTTQVVRSASDALAASLVDAVVRSAPFAPMSDRVRCIASLPIVASFLVDKETAREFK